MCCKEMIQVSSIILDQNDRPYCCVEDDHKSIVNKKNNSNEHSDTALVILHFNDVYNIDTSCHERGGVASFYTALQHFSSSNPLIFFSGDVFNPSPLSTLEKGRHMVKFLNILNIHTACLGNHDLDFGLEHFKYLAGLTNFPWVISNILDAQNPSSPIGGALMYRLCEWQGYHLGIFGLGEKEWLESLTTVTEQDVIYVDFVEAALRMCHILRAKKCDLIIALTHMRAHNDKRLAIEVPDIDMILGGHDHEYYGARKIGKTLLVKSGTDFREFSWIKIHPTVKEVLSKHTLGLDYKDLPLQELVSENRSGGSYLMDWFSGKALVEWKCVEVSLSRFPKDPVVDRLVEQYIQQFDHMSRKLLAINEVILDTRFSILRTQETNVGTWLTDIIRFCLGAKLACLNSGTIRSDCLFPPGPFFVGYLLKMLPMDESLVLLEITGAQLREMMEISVARYPQCDGRFLQISGFQVVFDARQPSMQRIMSIQVEDTSETGSIFYRPIQPEERFSLATKTYLKLQSLKTYLFLYVMRQQGKDGYILLKEAPVLPLNKQYSSVFNLIYEFLKELSLQCTHCMNTKTSLTIPAYRNNSESMLRCGVGWQNGMLRIRARKRNTILNIANLS